MRPSADGADLWRPGQVSARARAASTGDDRQPRHGPVQRAFGNLEMSLEMIFEGIAVIQRVEASGIGDNILVNNNYPI